MTRLSIRPEQPHDVADIRAVNVAAFADHEYSQQTEHLIVEALRAAGALEISLVAEADGAVVGHIAFSSASVGTSAEGWYLLGPIAVLPAHQAAGVGSALVEAGLALLRDRAARGCALVGDPGFYGRFGFRHYEGVTCEGVPDEFVLCLPFDGSQPRGEIVYHEAFFVQP
jgi:putative acetyltransferase